MCSCKFSWFVRIYAIGDAMWLVYRGKMDAIHGLNTSGVSCECVSGVEGIRWCPCGDSRGS